MTHHPTQQPLPMPGPGEFVCGKCGQIRLQLGSTHRPLPGHITWQQVDPDCAAAVDAERKAELDARCAAWVAMGPGKASKK